MTNYEMEKQRIQANYDAYIKFAKEEKARMIKKQEKWWNSLSEEEKERRRNNRPIVLTEEFNKLDVKDMDKHRSYLITED